MAEERIQSKVHRFEVGDKVAYTTDGHDELSMQSEGVVKSFENEEKTYLSVDFGNDDVHVLTEDELRRLA
jgi:hypothetical protein